MERQTGESELLLTCRRTAEGVTVLRCAADTPHVVLPDLVLGQPVTALGPYALSQLLLEVVSAVATVGLSTGITPSLTPISQITLILLMFAGRLGVMTLAIAFGDRGNPSPLRRPKDRILIG